MDDAIKSEAKTLRASLKAIAKRYGYKISVRVGTGSMRGTLQISKEGCGTAFYHAILDELSALGYIGCFGQPLEEKKAHAFHGGFSLSVAAKAA